MPRTMLTGTLDEQCAFLMDLAQQKVAAGNYTGAVHALKEIQKHAPDYPGLSEWMAKAQVGKREQRVLVFSGFGGAILAVFIGTMVGVPNDLWLLGIALAWVLVGYLVGAAVTGKRPGKSVSEHGR
jgi:hypothetical protein